MIHGEKAIRMDAKRRALEAVDELRQRKDEEPTVEEQGETVQ